MPAEGTGAYYKAITDQQRSKHDALTIQLKKSTIATSATKAAQDLIDKAKTDNKEMSEYAQEMLMREASTLDFKHSQTLAACKAVLKSLDDTIKRFPPTETKLVNKTQQLVFTSVQADIEKTQLEVARLQQEIKDKKISAQNPEYIAAEQKLEELQTAQKSMLAQLEKLNAQRTALQEQIAALENNKNPTFTSTEKAINTAIEVHNHAKQTMRLFRAQGSMTPIVDDQLADFDKGIDLTALNEVCDKVKGSPESGALERFKTQVEALNKARAEFAALAQLTTTSPQAATAYAQEYNAALRKVHDCYNEINKTISIEIRSGVHLIERSFEKADQREDLRKLTQQLHDEERLLTKTAEKRKVPLTTDLPLIDGSTQRTDGIPVLGEELSLRTRVKQSIHDKIFGETPKMDEDAPCTLIRRKWIPDEEKCKKDIHHPDYWKNPFYGHYETTETKISLNFREIQAVVAEWNNDPKNKNDQIKLVRDEKTGKCTIDCGDEARANKVMDKLIEASAKKDEELAKKQAPGATEVEKAEEPMVAGTPTPKTTPGSDPSLKI